MFSIDHFSKELNGMKKHLTGPTIVVADHHYPEEAEWLRFLTWPISFCQVWLKNIRHLHINEWPCFLVIGSFNPPWLQKCWVSIIRRVSLERISSQRDLFVFEIKNEWSITIEIHWSAKPICLHSLSRINNIWSHWLGCPWCFFNADYIFGYRVSSMLLPKLIENSFKQFPTMTCFYSFISRYIIHNYWWLLRRN